MLSEREKAHTAVQQSMMEQVLASYTGIGKAKTGAVFSGMCSYCRTAFGTFIPTNECRLSVLSGTNGGIAF